MHRGLSTSVLFNIFGSYFMHSHMLTYLPNFRMWCDYVSTLLEHSHLPHFLSPALTYVLKSQEVTGNPLTLVSTVQFGGRTPSNLNFRYRTDQPQAGLWNWNSTVESYMYSYANASIQFLYNYSLPGHIPTQYLTTQIQLGIFFHLGVYSALPKKVSGRSLKVFPLEIYTASFGGDVKPSVPGDLV